MGNCCAMPACTESPIEEEKNVKLLLLGTAASGKSTLFKQLDILCGKPWSRAERKEYCPSIIENTVDAIKIILSNGFRTLGIPAALQARASLIMGIEKDVYGKYNLTPQIATAIESLWGEPLMKKAFGNCTEYQLCDSADRFLDKVKQLSSPTYVPEPKDICYSQVPTLDIHEKTHAVSDVQYTVVDVGGQKDQREKWIRCVKHVDALLFTVDMGAYERGLAGNTTCNQLTEAMDVFGLIVNLRYFKNTNVILCLNKVDLFGERIATKDLRNEEKHWFEDYEGGCNEKAARQYIVNKFLARCEDKSKKIHVRDTLATSTRNIEHLFNDLRKNILDL